MTKETDKEKQGISRSFYLEPEVSDKIDRWASKKDRSASWVANRLLKQALVCPMWKCPGVTDEG